jgi:single-stranded DNA-binding protein
VRGINRVIISGNLSSRITYAKTGNGSEVCTFTLASDRPGSNGVVVSAYIKCNVYSQGLVDVCRRKLAKGSYVIVEGELMNRDGQIGELTEVRARDVIFVVTTPEGGSE